MKCTNVAFSVVLRIDAMDAENLDCWPDMPDLPPPGEFGRHTLS